MCLVAGCYRAVPVATTKFGCITTAPPAPPVLERTPCDHALCLDKENEGELSRWAARANRWMEGAWHRCK